MGSVERLTQLPYGLFITLLICKMYLVSNSKSLASEINIVVLKENKMLFRAWLLKSIVVGLDVGKIELMKKRLFF